MKIVMFTWEYPPVTVGGLGKAVFELATHLSDIGHEILIISRGPFGVTNLTTPVWEKNIKVIFSPEDKMNLDFKTNLIGWSSQIGFSVIKNTFFEIKDFDPDIIHVHDWLLAQPALTISKLLKKPIVSTIHATESGRHNGWINTANTNYIQNIEWFLAQSSNQVIVCTEFMKKHSQIIYGVDKEKISVIPNGIESKFITEKVPNINHKLKTETTNILFAGRLEWEKGPQDLILAIKQLLSEGYDLELQIAGSGTQLNHLEKLCDDEKIKPYVTFLGNLNTDDLKVKFIESDILIIPSHFEPFSLVALEAASVGSIIIVPKSSGSSEVIRARELAYEIIPEKIISIVNAVKEVLKNPEEAKNKAMTLSEIVKGKAFNWANIATQISKIYEELQGKCIIEIESKPDFPNKF